MGEYIEREALRNEILKISIDTSNLYGCGVLEGLDRATKRINEIPAADVVEVVRCKDCKHRTDETYNGGNYLCNRKMMGLVRPIDFCSYGERKGT